MKTSAAIRSLLQELIEDKEYQTLQYYIRSMKTAPHGGVFHIYRPGMFLSYYPCKTYVFLVPGEDTPFPIKQYCNKIKPLLSCENINLEDLLVFCFGVDELAKDDPVYGDRVAGAKLYTATAGKVLVLKSQQHCDYDEAVMNAAYGKTRFTDFFEVDFDRLALVFVCFVLSIDLLHFTELQDITALEKLHPKHDKYGLTKITSASLKRQGFIIWGKYYLYNIFFDTSIGGPTATVPRMIDVYHSLTNADLFMRCDETLAVPMEEMVSTATVDFQKWRGITLKIDCIEKQNLFEKEVIVHFDPSTMNKLLLIVKPDSALGEKYFHITIEQLWNPDCLPADENIILTNFIHGCYFPNTRVFDHIDFSINQYTRQIYSKKYRDAVSVTSVPIDQYAEQHYKVWCIKGNEITTVKWAELVECTLDEPFRFLFAEAIGTTMQEN